MLARTGLWLVACLLAVAGTVWAEVLEVDDGGFVSGHEIEIGAPPARVFDALVEEVSQWWDAAHSYSGDAANFSMDWFCGGLCEELDSEGLIVVHMRFALAHHGKTLVLSGGLGPLQRLGVAGSMSFDFEPTEAGTRIVYRYVVSGRNVGQWAEPVDRVQHGQLLRLKRYVETGSPTAE